MAKGTESPVLIDGSMDWSSGVDSSKTKTIQSDMNPNGVRRNQLVWLTNATVRGGGITQRTGWAPVLKIIETIGGYWQGGFMYEPDSGYPYLVCSISGTIYKITLDPPTVTDLTSGDPALKNPGDPNIAEMAFFCQAENYLVIQAGDYYTKPPAQRTLPLFWNGTTLRRSIGLNPAVATPAPNKSELPAATSMDYFGNRIWYGGGRNIAAGDTAGGPSGTAAENFRDAVISVTENALCFGGDGFSLPTSAGNVRAIRHSANINASLGQGQLHIFTRKSVFVLNVPGNRADWIAADINSLPRLDVVQLVNGAVGDRCIVPINGDLFYQSFDPAIRSLTTAVRNFTEWGNTPISNNEQRAVELNDRSLMRFSSGIEFDNRVLQLWLPQLAIDGVNVIHKAILPLDFDVVTTLEERKPPAWEGAYDGRDWLQLFSGDFGGRPRAFGAVVSDVDGSIGIWELTTADRMENKDNRVIWSVEFPAFTWASAGHELRLKRLNGGECWVDKVAGTVEFVAYYRGDADPCWRPWFKTEFCAARCEDLADSATTAYPCEPTREGYKFPVVFPEPPKNLCDSMAVRPSTIGYQFQVKLMIKGWCRIRGLMLYALPQDKPQFQGIACPTDPIPGGMRTMPAPFP